MVTTFFPQMENLVGTNENSICLAAKCAYSFLEIYKEVDTCRESTATLPPMVLGQDLRIIT